ncbi:SMP-30/gluconolactonase/LRE family protein [Nocardioides nitrophenolicus]|uniref:SMP-30/gluconolactonase/LRE family protein n=1 Tax=Nocardioides nitrophenolicus TaxID=60489 RepID=UPI00195DB597|nr:SMP-30/gluconolactonase/LRE family protein [Nocardioides nitrophenolicus]MBM7516446.1 sugar lactone lactonase YvrE [Nocardioides nitrophenolicus]
MTPAAPVVALASADLLGEGPWWDERTGTLVRVDIRARAVRRWHPASGSTAETVLPDEVSLALPRRTGGLVVTQVDRVGLLDADGRLEDLVDVEATNPETRLNDGACDDDGLLWVGTYSPRMKPDAGLHVVRPDGSAEQVLDGLVASNGLAWHGDLLYAVDTGRAVVDRYRRGPGTTLRPLGPLVELDPATELPDGIALDREGAVWVAVLKAGEVRRYLPDGRVDVVVPVPVTSPTSVAFGGAGLDRLFVTSSSYALPPDHAEPAGSVLEIRPGVRGVPVRRFAG